MKKWMIFLGGVLTGIVLTFLVLFIVGKSVKDSDGVTVEEVDEVDEVEVPGLSLFDEPGEVIDTKSFKVFHALGKGAALVDAENPDYVNYKNIKYSNGLRCLLLDKDGMLFYDDQIIKVPEGKVVRQIGVYQYETRAEFSKTVAVVRIMDK